MFTENKTEVSEFYTDCLVISTSVACQASLSFTISWSFLKLLSTESMMLFKNFILCLPFLILPSIFPSIWVFPSESALWIKWPKYWNFSFSISPSNEYSGLISFRMDWLDLFAVQGTLKSLFQQHSSKESVLSTQCSLWSNSYIHTWLLEKPLLWLYICTLVRKVMSLLFNMLSKPVMEKVMAPTPVLLPGKSHGQRNLVGYSPWGH